MASNLLHRSAKALFALLGVLLPATVSAEDCGIKLLVPLPSGKTCLSGGSTPFDVMSAYFQELYPWIVGTAAGIAVLWGLVAGAAMIFYAGDDSKRGEAKEWFRNAVLGLFLIIFSSMILHFLNPLFFK